MIGLAIAAPGCFVRHTREGASAQPGAWTFQNRQPPNPAPARVQVLARRQLTGNGPNHRPPRLLVPYRGTARLHVGGVA